MAGRITVHPGCQAYQLCLETWCFLLRTTPNFQRWRIILILYHCYYEILFKQTLLLSNTFLESPSIVSSLEALPDRGYSYSGEHSMSSVTSYTIGISRTFDQSKHIFHIRQLQTSVVSGVGTLLTATSLLDSAFLNLNKIT